MSVVARTVLSSKFQNGDRPNETDFSDLIDSCLNKASDGLTIDSDLNLVLTRGLRLGNSAGTSAGGLRFNAGQVQFHDGTNWLPVGGNAGAFTTIGATTAVAYGGGNVGVGTFPAAAPPTYRLEVNLAPNTSTAEQVRFGNAVVSSGTGAFQGYAYFAHRDNNSSTNYALRQSPQGATHINAADGQVVSLRQNGNVRMALSTTGQVIVASESNLTGSANQPLQVNGGAFKNDGSGTWAFTSDARVKEDVRDLEVGLQHLRRMRPVRYRYNGRAGTCAGLPGIGILGQEIEQVLPETIERAPVGVATDDGIEELRIFNPSALTFVLINAVKELADRVEKLEQQLDARDARSDA
ncbi:MAG: tail fiber domain-containing protein [Methylotetracoccus sp.]